MYECMFYPPLTSTSKRSRRLSAHGLLNSTFLHFLRVRTLRHSSLANELRFFMTTFCVPQIQICLVKCFVFKVMGGLNGLRRLGRWGVSTGLYWWNLRCMWSFLVWRWCANMLTHYVATLQLRLAADPLRRCVDYPSELYESGSCFINADRQAALVPTFPTDNATWLPPSKTHRLLLTKFRCIGITLSPVIN